MPSVVEILVVHGHVVVLAGVHQQLALHPWRPCAGGMMGAIFMKFGRAPTTHRIRIGRPFVVVLMFMV